MKDFDPNKAAPDDSGIFGLPFTPEESRLILIPVPWEATTSYGGGTSQGPAAILKASRQVDLFDLDLGDFYKSGICLIQSSRQVSQWNEKAKKAADKGDETVVNELSKKLNQFIYSETKKYLGEGKIVGLVGGDHSSPFGAIQAIHEKFPKMGILHVDAHADLRKAFEGFNHSHASIMYNVVSEIKIDKLIQVGIRDFCEEEMNAIKENEGRIHTFFDLKIFESKSKGQPWETICDEIIRTLPGEVYISFDVDGLDPVLCPHTGTPVPGGLSFHEACSLFKAVVKSGRKIVGFDLNEVAPGPGDNEWDANVGARVLYKLCGWALKS